MIIIMLCYFEIFTSCQGSMRIFSKHYSKCKTVSIKFRKTLQERRLTISSFSQDKPQNNFFNYLTSKTIFITLQYSGDILGVFVKQTFVECSSNILETLLSDYWHFPKDQNLLFWVGNKFFILQLIYVCKTSLSLIPFQITRNYFRNIFVNKSLIRHIIIFYRMNQMHQNYDQ